MVRAQSRRIRMGVTSKQAKQDVPSERERKLTHIFIEKVWKKEGRQKDGHQLGSWKTERWNRSCVKSSITITSWCVKDDEQIISSVDPSERFGLSSWGFTDRVMTMGVRRDQCGVPRSLKEPVKATPSRTLTPEAIGFLSAVGVFVVLLAILFLFINKKLCFARVGGLPCFEHSGRRKRKDRAGIHQGLGECKKPLKQTCCRVRGRRLAWSSRPAVSPSFASSVDTFTHSSN
ncbi:hypothetical protein SRHO_G00035500 [Serrasalmus rhombeus]